MSSELIYPLNYGRVYRKSDSAPLSNLPFTGLPLDDVGNSEWERTAAAEDELVEELAVFFLEGSEKKLELEAETAAEEELEAAGLLLLLLEEDTDAELELEETALTLRFFTVPGVFRSVISSLPTIRSETSSPDAAPCAIGSWAEKAVAAAVWLQSNITARAASRAEGVSSSGTVTASRFLEPMNTAAAEAKSNSRMSGPLTVMHMS